MLTESAPPVADAEILDELARHLKLTPGDQADEAADAFAAAVSHLEATLGLCLVPRGFVWRGRLSADGRVRAPMGPVRSLTSVNAVRSDGTFQALDLAGFTLDRTETRTGICSRRLETRELEIAFEAGFGAGWSDTPGDLRRAALMLSAHFFDQRHAAGDRMIETPLAVASLLGPWRSLRLTAGVKR